jgi:hypothetical protein
MEEMSATIYAKRGVQKSMAYGEPEGNLSELNISIP